MVFRYAIATARAERDPSMDLRGALTTPQVNHRATIIDPKGIGALLRAIDGLMGNRRPALRYVWRRTFLCDPVNCGTLSGKSLTLTARYGASRQRK